MKNTQGCTQRHPLLNPDSPHYHILGDEAITLMESMFSNTELTAWAKITAMKYRLRIGNKDSPDKEIAKIKTYENYFRYLQNIPASSVEDGLIRILRSKSSDSRLLDYQKCQHTLDELIRVETLKEQSK